MSRTRKCRKIRSFPDYYSFIPEDAEAEGIETIMLSLDEFETMLASGDLDHFSSGYFDQLLSD